jgi:hypothetical protein
VILVLRQTDLADGGAAQALGGERSAQFLVADLDHVFITGVGRLHGGPLRQQFGGGRVLAFTAQLGQAQHGAVSARLGRPILAWVVFQQHLSRGVELLDFPGQSGLGASLGLVATHGIADLSQVAGARGRQHRGLVGAVAHVHFRQTTLAHRQAELGQAHFQGLVERSHTIVIKARRHGAEHRHLIDRCGKRFLVALHLLGDVAQRIRSALAVELVDDHKLGKVKHVDFFKLAGGAEFGRHHVHRHIHMRHDGGVALADARGLDNDQIESGHLAGRNHIGQGGADLAAKVARGQAAHEDALTVVRSP